MPRETDNPPYTIRTNVEKWRFACPTDYEHRDWYAWDGKFGCSSCKALANAGEDVETVYEHLLDTKTGELVTRADLNIEKRSARPAAAGD